MFVVLLATIASQATPVAVLDCTLTAADKAANARLSFDDFDQRGTLRSTWRALSEGGCERQAIEAAEDYLLHGPPRTDTEQRDVSWHLAQSLALVGDEREAAYIMAGTREPGTASDGFDWNDYVIASWAFLLKDRARFDAAAARLASAGEDNRANSAHIAALGRCWNRPYKIAYNVKCGK